ncbi:hypothetical protein AVEN_197295-1 [Araneus ventricosus]|uniref:Uncharacterized protein n=1 Tax=Araneus ventricosus TaxID=182803 RepID=A0A4Y2P7R0_ARAVE|nr:hypothetical protein AVEN_197295-1 [Araneus ventricosus]
MYKCYGYRFGDESEMASSVGEFASLAYRTTVLRQSSRLTTFARSVAGPIEIWSLPFAGAKGSCLSSNISELVSFPCASKEIAVSASSFLLFFFLPFHSSFGNIDGATETSV